MGGPHPQFGSEKVLAVLSKSQLVRLEEFRSALQAVFPAVQIISPANLDELGASIRRCRESHRLVIAIGGDGTLHQVLQHIDTERQVLGLLPAGTGNDFARVLGYPSTLRGRAEFLRGLTAQPTDFGLINGIRFHNSAGFGLDSETLRRRENSKSRLRDNYIAMFLLSLLSLRCDRLTITHDSGAEDGRFYWVLGMNTPFIGGGTKIAPEASIDDGLLDMVLIRETGKLALLRCLPLAVKGRHIDLPITIYKKSRSIVCEGDEAVEYIAVDGELYYCGKRRVEMSIGAGRMNFLR